MSGGRVISRPVPVHECAPGWRTEVAGDGHAYGIPPTSWDFPKGTLWECSCGRAWVSLGAPAPNSPGFTHWRREGWRARRRRLRVGVTRGGYPAGGKPVSELPPPPASVTERPG